MSGEYGFGLIGCGGISHTHIRELRNINGVRLRAVSDISETVAKATGEREGVAWYTDFREMLQRDDIHVVNIVTPSGTHSDIIQAAAKAGKHVVVEKPMDISLEKAERAVAACHEADVQLAVISQHRFDEATILVKEAIASNQFGRMFQGTATVNWYRGQAYFDRSAGAGTWAMDGGGVFMIQAYHMIDVLQHLMGSVRRVYCRTQIATHRDIEVEDSAVATLEFVNGAIGTVSATTSAFPGLTTRIETFGETGSAVIEDDVLTSFYIKESNDDANMFGVSAENQAARLRATVTETVKGYAHRRQIEDLIASIEENREPIVSGDDGLQTLRLILGMYESARTGLPVEIKAHANNRMG